MKDNKIHVCFVIDESGSMYSSHDDVVGGFQNVINEQKSIEDGECVVSLYTFNDTVKTHYVGQDINDIVPIEYSPCGCTAMNDGIGTAIDGIGKWLSDMDEDERPSKNLIVIMTDGQENSSKEYSLAEVQERIQHQTEKYNWTFMYIGTDITTTKDVDALGIKTRSFSARKNLNNNYKMIDNSIKLYRTCANRDTVNETFANYLNTNAKDITKCYEDKIGKKIN